MKFKKIATKVLICLCVLSIVALGVVLFAGCSSNEQTLSSYDLNVNFNDEEKLLSCKENLTYINETETALSFLCLHLYPNAFREGATQKVVSLSNEAKAYPNGKSYGSIKIQNVSVLHNTAKYSAMQNIAQPTYSEITEYWRTNSLTENQYFIGGEDQNILYIIFKDQLFPSEKTEIEIDFEVKLPNINHRFGYGNNTVNIANFYPIACMFTNGDFDKSPYSPNGDPFFSNMSNYNVTLTVPNEYVVSNTGKARKETQDETTKTLEIEASSVRDFAIVLSKEFKVLSKTVGTTEVKYYYFNDSTPEESLKAGTDALEYFSKTFGKYPYSTLSVVQANFVHGGMEFPNLVYISNDVVDPNFYKQVIVHEIAHQWWYNLVGSNAFKNGWLDEGLTEYSTALFFEDHEEYGISKDSLINNAYSLFSLFVQVYEKVYGNVDTSMNRALNEYESEQQYTYVAYVKGMLFFDSLREILGKEKFEKCLQNYFKEYKFQNVTPENMIASFEKTAKCNLENYFNAWISGEVILLK